MQTLHSARSKLEAALDEYANACATLTTSSLKHSRVLRSEINTEIELLTDFEKRTAQVKSTLNRTRNSLSVPINSLPDEILDRIFYFTANIESSSFDELVDDDRLPMNSLAMSQVCARWRRVTFSSKSLWAHINLSARSELVPLAQVFAARSGDLPLSVRAVEQFDLLNVWRHALLDKLFAAVGHRLETIELNLAYSLFPPNRNLPALQASLVHCRPGQLTRLVLSDRKIYADKELSNGCYESSGHWFIIPNDFKFPRITDHHHYTSRHFGLIRLDISQTSLEEILYHVKILKLDQIYPFWTSKAYHGLTELRLTGPRRLTAVIGEGQLADILAASPELRVLHFGLEVSLEETPRAPVRLEHLEVFMLQSFSYDTQQTVLRLILPGTKRLQMSTTYNQDRLLELPTSVEEEYCRFFKRSNIVRFHVHCDLLLVQVPQLLALLPNLEVLILHAVTFEDVNPPANISTPLCPNLRAIYINTCHISVDVIRWMVCTHNLEKVGIWNNETRFEGHFADISPPVQFLDAVDQEGLEIEGWGFDMEERMAASAMAGYVVH